MNMNYEARHCDQHSVLWLDGLQMYKIDVTSPRIQILMRGKVWEDESKDIFVGEKPAIVVVY